MIAKSSQTILNKLIRQKTNALNYINHRPIILARTKKYNQNNREKVVENKRNWDAIFSTLNMHGLCHICFCSNVEIFNHKGQILCDSCMQDQLRDG